MKRNVMMTMLCALALAACDEAEAPAPQQVYQPLAWAEVEAVLPRVPAARELGRQQLPEALGLGLCLEHEHPAARIDEALAASGWKVTSRDAITEERIDYLAEREGLQLSGSLTAAPAEGCPSGFLYTLRKTQVTR